MKRFAVIGLGHYGAGVAKALFDAGHEVIAIDSEQRKVNAIASNVSQAVCANAVEKQVFIDLELSEVDAAIVSLGDRMDIITLAALHLKEIGVRHLAVKAISDDHAKILHAIGVDEVVHPEAESAIRLARRMAMRHVVDVIPLHNSYSIVTADACAELNGRTVGEVESNHLQVVGIQKKGEKLPKLSPESGLKIETGDLLIILGEDSEIEKFAERFLI